MELVSGDDLDVVLQHGRLPASLVLRVLEDVAHGLGAVHRAGIVHRDLKPANLRLEPRSDGRVRVKLLDFGLVRDRFASPGLTDTGTAPGTLTYMSPEILDEQVPDQRADLYSLGVIAYEMLTGRPPFRGTSQIEIAIKHLREQPRPVESLVPESLPDGLGDLVHSMLVKERERRIAQAELVLSRAQMIRRRAGLEYQHSRSESSFGPMRAWGLLPHLPPDAGSSG
jgi:serine/threonine-protein kinase